MLTTTISEFKQLAHTIYNKEELPTTILTAVGESGIGKTDVCLQFIKELDGYEATPRVINVAHLNIEDMGMPAPNGDEDFIRFKLSQLFKVGNENVIVLLDELNRPNNESVMNFLMGAINERRLFGNPISDRIRFMATMNPNNEHYPETQDIFADIAVRRRFNPIELRYDYDQFMDYSRSVELDDGLIAFLTQNPEQVLIPGKVNCPRQWHRFHRDILDVKKYEKDERSAMKVASSLYMDNASTIMWLKHWEGILEKFVRATEILKDFPIVLDTLNDQLSRNKMDMLSATCDDIRNHLRKRKTLSADKLDHLKDFLLIVPKSLAFVVIEDLIQNSALGPVMKKYCYKQDDLMELIMSGTSQ